MAEKMEIKTIGELLLNIQQSLKAPKNKVSRDKSGKVRYLYRSCEDILESVKPLLKENNCVLTITDEIVYLGDRFYVKATATLTTVDTMAQQVSVTAYAREDNNANMSGAQNTGASSSYARKYALNGLFAIDDTKDADDLDAMQNPQVTKVATPADVTAFCNQNGISLARLCGYYGVQNVNDFTPDRYEHLNNNMQAMIAELKKGA